MVYKCFDKKSASSGVNTHVQNKFKQNQRPQLQNYTNQLLNFFKKRTVYSGFKDNIWGNDLADMQLTSKFNKGFRFLLCVIDIFSKYAWVVHLKDKKGITITNGRFRQKAK